MNFIKWLKGEKVKDDDKKKDDDDDEYDDEDELFELGYEEYFYGEGVCVVEWADLIEGLLPPETKLIRIEHGTNPEERIYQCTF